jgi:hypothetical protein
MSFIKNVEKEVIILRTKEETKIPFSRKYIKQATEKIFARFGGAN